jgi:Pyridoxamine 5'-phosphate oxidase like
VTPENRIWEIIEKAGICMMVTRFADGLRGRPLEARPNREENAIFFLTDLQRPKGRRSREQPSRLANLRPSA